MSFFRDPKWLAAEIRRDTYDMGNDTHVANVGGVVHQFTELLSCKIDHDGNKNDNNMR